MNGWHNPAPSAPPLGATNSGWDNTPAPAWTDAMESSGAEAFEAPAFAESGADMAGEGDNNCRNCGQEGHFARDCTEPRKMCGACFNCGQEGHSKNECTEPRVFKGECRNCNQEGHRAEDCPTRVEKCNNCHQEGHAALDCKNPKVIDNARVPEKSEDEAWALLQQASEERDIGDFKEAVQILSKACPDYTYPKLEKEFRSRGFSIYMIAMEKDIGEIHTNVNLQGEIGKKYAVSYFTSDKANRPALVDKWPASAEENLARLADAGTPLDRGVPKCTNCNELGHMTRRCPQEKMASVQPVVTCFLCGEEGHRVRDCTQERKKAGRACKICESEEHLAKDCPNREKRTCRNCGEEDHMASECPNPRKVTCNICSDEGHMARECPRKSEFPRPKINWAEVTCSICNKKGHGRKRCPEADTAEDGGADTGMNGDSGDATADSGDWEQPTNNGSAPTEWESAPTNDAFGSAAVGDGW